ncbi:sodium:alanine symporter family protein [Fusobacterium mortiferum]|uniref:alanine/glycine:cation symporter family protein n=1 Tax=Fusobacterium mortiferum TaxID=850 RepID=UPI00195ED6BC|nr:sodium:alanine symporter family protein [Fusobacterium mortiferum]
MEIIREIINFVNEILWGKNILVVMLVGTALYLTLRTRFMQFRLFGDIIKILGKDDKNKDGISSLEAFFLGTACRVGAGNITGVVAAISVGGPGSIFWMWLVALLGAATSFVESCLAVKYREQIGRQEYRGGTPWIIEKRLKKRWLGVIYAVASIVCYIGVIQVMSNSVTESVNSAYKIDIQKIAIALSVIVALIVFIRGKKDTIIVALNKIVPVMAIMYLLVVVFVVLTNLTSIPAMLGNIISQAFGVKEIAGGGIGIVIMQGVRRGLFSNEAGSGNSNYAAAVVDVNEPAKQGMVQALGVFVDTLVVCSATAFIVLLADSSVIAGTSGMTMFQEAIKSHIGWIGIPFTVIVLFFFSLSTILGVTFYGKNAINFVSEAKEMKYIYHVVVVLMVYIGGIEQNFFVWSLADFGLGIMTVINIICLVPIAGEAIEELKKYEKILKREKQN